MPHALWDRTRQVNLDGSFFVVQGEIRTRTFGIFLTYVTSSAVANQMKNQSPQGGSIVGISSISALVGGEYQWYVVQFHQYR
jgi:L-rhamnose 1-dehydrogenase